MKPKILTRNTKIHLLIASMCASPALFGTVFVIEDFEAFDLGNQSANAAGSFTIVDGVGTTESGKAAQINNSGMQHGFLWTGDGKAVTTFSFDLFNPDPVGSANNTVNGRILFAFNQNTGGLTSGGNNLIRLSIGTDADREQGIFAFQSAGSVTYPNQYYPLNTIITAHLILNNTTEAATNSNGQVTVAPKTVQLWTEINGVITLAGSSTFAAGREESDLARFGFGTPGGYTGEGYVIDNLRYEDGIAIIPEPSTYAALAGLLALGLVIVRRRAAFQSK